MAKPCQEVKPCKGRKLNASVPVDSDPEEEVIEDHEDRSPLLKARQQAKRSNSQSPIENYKDSGKRKSLLI